jgi:hypothetical protein
MLIGWNDADAKAVAMRALRETEKGIGLHLYFRGLFTPVPRVEESKSAAVASVFSSRCFTSAATPINLNLMKKSIAETDWNLETFARQILLTDTSKEYLTGTNSSTCSETFSCQLDAAIKAIDWFWHRVTYASLSVT